MCIAARTRGVKISGRRRVRPHLACWAEAHCRERLLPPAAGEAAKGATQTNSLVHKHDSMLSLETGLDGCSCDNAAIRGGAREQLRSTCSSTHARLLATAPLSPLRAAAQHVAVGAPDGGSRHPVHGLWVAEAVHMLRSLLRCGATKGVLRGIGRGYCGVS